MENKQGLYIPRKYLMQLLELPKLDFAGLMRAIVKYAAEPEAYTEALPPAPLSVHHILAALVDEMDAAAK